ncbi:MAG: (Fe-S)-binding protein [Alphaproteobacteria bacterium]|nr:(Fe-S)-binding protein [Alphaproteobacteria bacterium]
MNEKPHGDGQGGRLRVGLFVTCLVDLFRPSVGFAAVKLLEEAGCTVEAPAAQTSCGQPAHNSGDRRNSRAIARQVIEAFENFDALVVPSGSCAGMIKHHYPELFNDDAAWRVRAEALAGKSFELVSFLTDELGVESVAARFDGSVTYHDSCAGLRELGVREQPRKLLGGIPGLRLEELPGADICCGFGGTFCVKYGEISTRMVRDKTADIGATGAGTVLAGDLGCLLNIAGRLSREGRSVEVRHVAEVLADMADGPAIGEPAAAKNRARPAR